MREETIAGYVGKGGRHILSVHKFLCTQRGVVISRRAPILGLIGHRRPLTAVITFNRIAICAARVSTADRVIDVEDVTRESRRAIGNTASILYSCGGVHSFVGLPRIRISLDGINNFFIRRE